MSPRSTGPAASVLAPLLGAAVLTAQVLWALPWRSGSLKPATPFERTPARSLAPGYLLLRRAASSIPNGASFVVQTNPPDATLETWYHRFGVALLPGRRALPAATFRGFLPPASWSGADYLVVVGPEPGAPAGVLVLRSAEGTVWRRGVSR